MVKKLKALPFLILSLLVVVFGFYACGGSSAAGEPFWVKSQFRILNVLGVDTYTPIGNITEPVHYLTWNHANGTIYRIVDLTKVTNGEQSDPDLVLSISGGSFELQAGQLVRHRDETFGVKIPSAFSKSTELRVDYASLGSPNDWRELKSGVYRRIVFAIDTDVNFYEINFNDGGNIYNNKQHVYDGVNISNPNTAAINFNTFAPANNGEALVFRTPATIEGDSVPSNFVFGGFKLWAVHLHNAADYSGYTRYHPVGSSKTDSELTSLLVNGNAAPQTVKGQTRAKNAIQGRDDSGNALGVSNANNVYSVVETKYLSLIRGSFVPLQLYSKLLGGKPRGLTDGNRNAYESDFAEFEKEVTKVTNLLNTITYALRTFAGSFEGTTDFVKAAFLTATDTPQYSELAVLETKLTGYLEKLITFAEKTQAFFAKYYGVEPDISTLDNTAKVNAARPNASKTYEQLIEDLFLTQVVSPATVKYELIAYQVSLLRPVYEYYFKANSGRYNKLFDEPLFEEYYRISDSIIYKTDQAYIGKTNQIIWQELVVYDLLREYVQHERSNLLTAISKVNHLAITSVSKRTDSVPAGTTAWSAETDYKDDYFLQINYRRNGRIVKVVNIFHFFAEKETQLNQWRVKDSEVFSYLARNCGQWENDIGLIKTLTIMKIKKDPVQKAYYNRMTTYLYEGLPVLATRTGNSYLGGLLFTDLNQTLYIESGKFYVPAN